MDAVESTKRVPVAESTSKRDKLLVDFDPVDIDPELLELCENQWVFSLSDS